MDAAYRAGLNRGSADKLAGRHLDDAVPPKYRTNDVDRRAYKKGYKHGYGRTKTPSERTGAERELTSSEAVIKNVAIEYVNQQIKAGVSGDVFVEEGKKIYAKAAEDADSQAAKYGRFDPKILKQEIGAIIYGKALEMKASPSSLASISYMATAEQLAATPKATAATPDPAPKTSVTMIRPGAFEFLRIDPQKLATKKPQASTVNQSPAPPPPQRTVETPEPSAPPVSQQQLRVLSAPPPPAYSPTYGPALVAPQPQSLPVSTPQQPSWFASNWYWLVGGAAVVAGGGYMFYTRNKR